MGVPDSEAEPVDFFISYAGPDRRWAEWAGEQLIAAGYSVELDVWDWAAGSNVVLNMNDALARARKIVALYSTAYFDRRRFTLDEWTAVMAERPNDDGHRRLVPLRVEEVTPPPILASLVHKDLFGLDELRARETLLTAVGGTRQRTATKTPFPGSGATGSPAVDGARVPGSYPALWNVPLRNPAFTGRNALLAALHERLTSGNRAWVQALHGFGGVGKTQLAIEYAHLFTGEYELVWWVDAERPELIGEQLATLAAAAGWADRETVAAVAVKAVMDRLRGMRRWLIVFDNTEAAEDLAPWLPPETGHLIITSRSSGFTSLAVPVEVDVFTRAESLTLLKRHLSALGDTDADRLADALGDLPLALAQAIGLITETRMSVDEYLTELAEHAADLLEEKKPLGYPTSLAAAIAISVDRLGREDPAAVQLLDLCCLLAPEPIPQRWFTNAPAGVLDKPLAKVVNRWLAWRRTLGRLARFGLVRITEETVQLHRLTQAVIRNQQSPDQRRADRERIETLLDAAQPNDDVRSPTYWGAWARLLPHLLVLDPATADTRLRTAACNALGYLVMRGEYQRVVTLAEEWRRRWRTKLGANHSEVLWLTNLLASGYWFLGRHKQARSLYEEIYTRCRRTFGDEDDRTLNVAGNLVNVLDALGEYEQAHRLSQQTFVQRLRVLGADHPDTLGAAHNLAMHLRHLGDYEQARRLDEDTLARRRRVLGEDHPDTLMSASSLAIDISRLGEFDAARRLDEETLGRRRRVLGEDHPDTLISAGNVAIDLFRLGEVEQARRLAEETLAHSRRVLGDEHPDTQRLAENLRQMNE